MTSKIDTSARTGLAARTLQAVGDYADSATEPQMVARAAALRDVEQDAADLGCGPLAAAAGLACAAARMPEPEADLWQHALDVLALVCLNELQEAEGSGRVDLDDVVDALRERVQFHTRAARLPVA